MEQSKIDTFLFILCAFVKNFTLTISIIYSIIFVRGDKICQVQKK